MTALAIPPSTSKSVQQPPKDDKTDWFEREEHLPTRTCTCFCGNTFRSQARTIQFLDKASDGKDVTVNGSLSKQACPHCQRHRIASFK